MRAPRGIRNHNPGNIRASRIDWDGEIKPGTEKTFTVFSAPWWGIRAMAKLLVRYHQHHGINTVAGMVARYAPGHENPTDIYAREVARAMGVPASSPFELNYYALESMVRAMIEFENGLMPYTWELPAGLIMAGMEPTVNVLADGQLQYTFRG